MAPYPNIGNTIRIFTDHGEETTTRNGPDDRFTDSANWEAFDAGNIGGLTTKGYFGAAFDGRYVYYVPCRTADFHGTALRYDTEGDFKSAASWESFDAGSTDGLATVGFAGAVFDGRYIYYIPFSDATSRHGRVLRFDTQGSFTEAASWDAYDAGMTGGSGTKGYNGAGVRDVMWASPDLYAGSDSLVTSDGINGAGSSTWVIDSDMVVSNGWSPGFGNPGGAGWRPGGAYGVLCGNTSNVVYVYDGGWTKEYTPVANNGGITNAIAWRSDGGRALLVGRPTGSSLSGTVIDYRPSDATYFEPGAMGNAGIPGFDKPPWSANSNTHLLDVDFRPGACDAGLIVGADTGSAFSPTFGTVIYFQDSADSVCPSI